MCSLQVGHPEVSQGIGFAKTRKLGQSFESFCFGCLPFYITFELICIFALWYGNFLRRISTGLSILLRPLWEGQTIWIRICNFAATGKTVMVNPTLNSG